MPDCKGTYGKKRGRPPVKNKGKKKIFGVCLGFQQILYAEGGKIIQQNNQTIR